MILVDTLRQDRVSAYGYEVDTTPFMRQLASEGVLLDGISPTSWTRPATASLFTGLHPLRHQTITSNDALPSEVETLAETLRRNGYMTLAVSANLHITKEWGFDQGFDGFLDMGEIIKDPMATADQVNQFLDSFLPRLQPPYFLYVHYIDPHAPYAPPTDGHGSPLSPRLQRYWPVEPSHLEGGAYVRHRRSLEFVQAASDLYDGEVRYVDSKIAELFTRLSSLGLLENTAWMLTSDHGEEFEDHGRMSHGQSLYSEVVGVPMIVGGPSIPQGIRLDGKVNLTDVVPTVLDLLAVRQRPPAGSFDGNSVAASILGGTPSPNDDHLLHLDHVDGHSLGFVSGSWKILIGTSPFTKELYDLGPDPGEKSPIAGGENLPQTFVKLNRKLVETYNSLEERKYPRTSQELNESSRAELAALGYLMAEGNEDSRRFPARIVAADNRPLGTTGLEGAISPCLDLGSNDSQAQLYGGFYYQEQMSDEERGRWTSDTASLSLSVPGAPDQHHVVVIRGINVRSEPHDLSARIGGQDVLRSASIVNPGAYEVRTSVVPRNSADFLVELAVTPGRDPVPTDDRTLGTFLTHICAEELPTASLRPHLDLLDDAETIERQTAYGVYGRESGAGGRWTTPSAGFYLGQGSSDGGGASILTLRGIGYRPGSFPLTVTVDGSAVYSTEVDEVGREFSIQIPLPPPAPDTSVRFVELSTTPFHPGPHDDNVRGLFLTSIGIQPAEALGVKPAIDLRAGTPDHQLVSGVAQGFEETNVPGRWTHATSSYLLALPPVEENGGFAVSVTGINLRCDRHNLTLSVNGVRILTRNASSIGCEAEFKLDALVPSHLISATDLVKLEMTVDPPLVRRLDNGTTAHLGTLIQEVAVRPAGATGAAGTLLFASPEAEAHMVHGFHGQEPGMDGRWISSGGAAYTLRVPDPPRSFYELVLNTVNFRPDGHTITIKADGKTVFQSRSGPQGAPLQAQVPLPTKLQPGDVVLVEVTVEPGYIPAEHGDPRDHRDLGTYLRRTWIQ